MSIARRLQHVTARRGARRRGSRRAGDGSAHKRAAWAGVGLALALLGNDSRAALEGTEAWVGRYDGGINDEAVAIAVDDAGASYVTGLSGGRTAYDVLTVKFDAAGREAWLARYDGPAGAYDEGTAVALDGRGHLYVAAAAERRAADMDFTVLKYDAGSGALLWAVNLDGAQVPAAPCPAPPTKHPCEVPPAPVTGPHSNRAEALAVLPDGGVAVTGSAGGPGRADFLTVNLDPNGALRWARRYDGPAGEGDFATAVSVDSAGNVLVAGRSRGARHYDIAVVKYTPGGEQRWARRYDGPVGWYDGASDVAIGPADSVLVAGTSFGRWRHTASVVLGYGADGELRWTARPFDARESSSLRRLRVDPRGGVVAAGSIRSQKNWNYLTFKLDPAGRLRWSAEYDGPGRGVNRALALDLDTAGNAFVSGVTDMTNDVGCEACPAFTTVKYASASGELLWAARYGGPLPGANRAAALQVHESDVLVTGMSAGLGSVRGRIGDSPRDFAVLKYRGVAEGRRARAGRGSARP